MAFQHDTDKSLRAFDKFTAPVLRHALNARTIMTTEPRSGVYQNDLAAALDRLAGIGGKFFGRD